MTRTRPDERLSPREGRHAPRRPGGVDARRGGAAPTQFRGARHRNILAAPLDLSSIASELRASGSRPPADGSPYQAALTRRPTTLRLSVDGLSLAVLAAVLDRFSAFEGEHVGAAHEPDARNGEVGRGERCRHGVDRLDARITPRRAVERGHARPSA